MLAIAIFLLLVVLLAAVVVGYVAFPHRGREVPGAPGLSGAVNRAVDRVAPELTDAGHVRRREPAGSR